MRAHKVPVWSPTRMVLKADIPATWDVTADSLAAWLARTVAAPRLLLVKRARPACDRVRIAALVADGTVDPLFPRLLKTSRAEAAPAGPRAHLAAVAALCSGAPFGTRIELG